ncbi:XdhC family protein [uncultured Rhodoblastus sp.]|uniref:XdhC family protein n=1 Tax=uncultured Rhodoblastus sp. TaxID=543037 RepID=UPI0025CEB453|nr:XdhC family protein [uncultured Rhodoblastus sp.]
MPTSDLTATMRRLQDSDISFAVATVVRTLSVTAAKAGAKAVILADGTIGAGWIGGGCARGATLKAAREAIADGRPRLICVEPKDLLSDKGVSAGEVRDGVRYAANMCPSQGAMEIFIEPVLPRPELVVMGASPVAVTLAETAGRFGYDVTLAAPARDHEAFAGVEHKIDGFTLPPTSRRRFIVVSTQGTGDEAALAAALKAEAVFVAFVGSRRKSQHLTAKLRDVGVPEDRLAALKAPAGLDIGAETPPEIALSILAELVCVRAHYADDGRLLPQPIANRSPDLAVLRK